MESVTEHLNIFNQDKIIDEQDYINECVDYATSTGWINEDEMPTFIEQYLKPIYKKYLEIIEEVKSEVLSEPDGEREIKLVMRRLNAILGRTNRIGSTDPSNIVRSIRDYFGMFCKTTYQQYAGESLAQFIAEKMYS